MKPSRNRACIAAASLALLTLAAVSGLAAGNYTVTITDGEQCTSSATATINQPGQLTVTASATPETTNGASDGTASSNAAGGTPPYSYLWSNDSITPSIENLAPGFYTVTITDANGCTALETAQVLAGDCGISATISTTSPNCFGEANGTATVNLTGGNGKVIPLPAKLDQRAELLGHLAPKWGETLAAKRVG